MVFTAEKMEELKQQVLGNRFVDCDRVIEICDILEKSALEREDHELLGFAYFHKGESYYVQNDIQLMFEYIAKAVPYLNETKQWNLLARSYNIMAITSINKGQAPIAVDYYLSALRCAKEHDLDSVKCSLNINLGYLYMQNGLYEDSRELFEKAYDLCSANGDKAYEFSRLTMIYTNLASGYILQGKIEQAGEYVERIHQECKSYFQDMDYVYVGCMEARYYNLCGDYKKRDVIIEDIFKRLDNQLPILDLFEDLYTLCELTLDIKYYDMFIRLADKMDDVVGHTHMINLEKKLLPLMIKYYKEIGDQEKYNQATSRFFDLSMLMDEENRQMIANMIYVRNQLELANETRRKVETANAVLTVKSETDALTGLANRYRLTEYADTIIDQCIREHKVLSVEILDIDFFKEYNDTYGHQFGDKCLTQVSDLLREMISDDIFCARYGGDEFMIIYTGLSEDEVAQRALQLKQKIMSMNLMTEEGNSFAKLTISQGIASSVPTPGNKIWDFQHIADQYLYHVKKKGRNGVCIGNLRGDSQFL